MQTTVKQPPPEMTVKAVSLGIFLAFVFGSANAYLGMKAGQITKPPASSEIARSGLALRDANKLTNTSEIPNPSSAIVTVK